MDVIFKEGMVYLQGVMLVKDCVRKIIKKRLSNLVASSDAICASNKKIWKKTWMVLFKASYRGVGRVEFYTIGNRAYANYMKTKTPERKVVRLSDCVSISPAQEVSCPAACTAFYLKTTQCTYVLASTASQQWLSALQLLTFQKDPGESDKGGFERGNDMTMEDNDLYTSLKDLTLPVNQYKVTIQSTEASRRCQLAGEYLVSLGKQAVMLLAIGTGHVIYRWPYTLIRKFGQCKGGFSIEAGCRCESGEGVFIFLSSQGPLIFQTISKRCSAEKRSMNQPVRVLTEQSPVNHRTTTSTEDESACHYSTINYSHLKGRPLSSAKPYFSNSKEALEGKSEEEDELCCSLEAVNQNNLTEDNIYCSLEKTTHRLNRPGPFKPKIDNSDCIYSDLKIIDPRLNPQLLTSPPLQPVPLPHPCTPPQSVPFAQPKPQYQPQHPAYDCIQPGYSAKAQGEGEMEEAISSSVRAPDTEAPDVFKLRLAKIFSKNLTRLEPSFPSGAGNCTVSQ